MGFRIITERALKSRCPKIVTGQHDLHLIPTELWEMDDEQVLDYEPEPECYIDTMDNRIEYLREHQTLYWWRWKSVIE